MPHERITLEQVKHVAKLARLDLSRDKLTQFTSQLESILQYVAAIGAVNVDGVEPFTHALPLFNVLREDIPKDSLPVDQVLLNAPDSDPPFFKVPKVIGEEDSAS
jgi:aspartyl-tRNA(Asn)/glutamyl-tRNA(Gln) amidotransferase subunit C